MGCKKYGCPMYGTDGIPCEGQNYLWFIYPTLNRPWGKAVCVTLALQILPSIFGYVFPSGNASNFPQLGFEPWTSCTRSENSNHYAMFPPYWTSHTESLFNWRLISKIFYHQFLFRWQPCIYWMFMLTQTTNYLVFVIRVLIFINHSSK